MRRHDLIFLNEAGKEHAFSEAIINHPGFEREFIRKIIVMEGIPGIVKRQEISDFAAVELGFSTRYYSDGSRIRINSKVSKNQILRIVSPFEVMDMTGEVEVYQRICKISEECGFQIGIYGSSALEIITGQSYRTKSSDIDLFIRGIGTKSNPEKFHYNLKEFENAYGMTCDVEIEYKGVYGIKLSELLSEQLTVLAKGLYDVKLLDREAVIAELVK